MAAILVVLFHAHMAFDGGELGVDIFFVLSGFLITRILLLDLARGRIRFSRFYKRRALRLLPAYFAVLVVFVILDSIWDVGGTLKGAVFSFLYISNWVSAAGVGLGAFAHTWSLAIEEQFYLVWPITLAIIVAWTRGAPRKTFIAVAAFLALAYSSILVAYATGVWPWFIWNSTLSRGTELLAGCALAVFLATRRGESCGGKRKVLQIEMMGMLCLISIIAVANFEPSSIWAVMLGRWPFVSLVTVGLIVACLRNGPLIRMVLGNGPMVAVGKVSYGLYLWHFPIFATVDSTLGIRQWPARLLAVGLTAIVVPISYHYVEKPFLRMKDRKTVAPRVGWWRKRGSESGVEGAVSRPVPTRE